MGLFKKKEIKVINVEGKRIELQPKPKKGLSALFGGGAKRQPKPQQIVGPAAQPQRPVPQPQQRPAPQPVQPAEKQAQPQQSQQQVQKKMQSRASSAWRHYIEKLAIKNRKIEPMLLQRRMRESLYDFIQRMLIASIIVAVVIAAAMLLVLVKAGVVLPVALVLTVLIGYVVNRFAFNSFLRYPLRSEEIAAKNVERDILFAARNMIISLRSGMPLYNAIVSVSSGYGDASKEFAKVTEKSNLGMSLEEAIDQTVSETKSQSFRRIMLQVSASIKAGADIVASLQSVTDQLSEERMISLRRYGQRLNAIAMFYMLFGVILPSMGIAIATILTTFISVFTVNVALLEAAIVGIVFLQVIFLQLIRSSRPVFAM